MSELLKLELPKLRKSPRGASVLGLTLDGGRLEGVVVRRTNGSVQVQQAFSATLTLDPLTNDPELVGREIRNHLTAAGIKERRCIVGLPLQWVLMVHVALPDLPEEDVASFLQLEAERGFPCDSTTLMIASSKSRLPSGERHGTLLGIPRNHATLVERALRAAQLRPASFSLGLPALQPPEAQNSSGVLALAIGETQVGLQISCGSGIAALRTLEGALEGAGGQRQLHADVLVREARITLAQLPAAIRDCVKRVRIFGPRDLAQQLADEIELRLEALKLEVEVVTAYAGNEFGVHPPAGAAVSAAFSLATGYLAGRQLELEFLPPRITPWQQFVNRYSSGKLQQAGMAAAAVVLLVGGAFGFQEWQLWRLRSQWSGIKNTVSELDATNSKIKQFRPWFDSSARGLTILRKLTEAFPDDGSVTAKTLEIRDLNAVTCTGIARDYQALLRTVERLRAIPQIELKQGQTRGQSPNMQFTINFVWSEGGAN